MSNNDWPEIPALQPIKNKSARPAAPELNPVDEKAVAAFNGAINSLRATGREFDELDGEQERKLAALSWLARPRHDLMGWMDLFNHRNNKRLLELMAQNGDLALGRYLAELITSYTLNDIRDAYGVVNPDPDEDGLNWKLDHRERARAANGGAV